MKALARITLLVTSLISMAVMAAVPQQQAEARAKEAELQHLRSTIQELSDNLNSLRSQHRDQRAKLRAMNREISKLDRAAHDTEKHRQTLTDKLSQLQQEKQAKQLQIADQRQALARQLRATYLLGSQDSLKILLSATEPAALQRSLKYYDYFYRSRAGQIADLKDSLHSLDDLQHSIQDKQQDLDALLSKQHTQREALESSRRKRNALVAELNHDIRSTKHRLSQLKEDEQSLRDLVKRLRRALEKMPTPQGSGLSFARLKGQLRLPAPGKITARFGTLRHVGQLKWQGIVIDATDGADVKAIAAGRVVFADWLRGFGLLLIIDHGGGYMSLYGYNQGLGVNVGDSVQAGEVVATAGNNSERTPGGLYFEIRHNGTPVNPLLWCKAH